MRNKAEENLPQWVLDVITEHGRVREEVYGFQGNAEAYFIHFANGDMTIKGTIASRKMEGRKMPIIQEAIDAVAKINGDIQEQTEEDSSTTYIFLVLKIFGEETIVEFAGINIWSSENDEREYEDDGKDIIYGPLEHYLRREINKMAQSISRIKL